VTTSETVIPPSHQYRPFVTSQKTGRMELADQGTLFLDEVRDIPVEIQPKLLRVLQEREFERLGSIHARRVNIRLNRTTFLSRMKKFGIYAKQYAWSTARPFFLGLTSGFDSFDPFNFFDRDVSSSGVALLTIQRLTAPQVWCAPCLISSGRRNAEDLAR